MHGNRAFPDGLTFVDCFGGTGVCVATDADGRTHRLPGSSVIAASILFQSRGIDGVTQKRFDRLIAVERSLESAAALRTRIAATGYSGSVTVVEQDFNVAAREVAASIPQRSLNVAFVDPFSLDVHFSAIQSIASMRSLDLVILFSDRIDLQRNVEHVYLPDPTSKLDVFLGAHSNWRDAYSRLADRSGGKLREMFAKLYLRQLRTLGYDYCDHWPLEGPQGPMFSLVFASKNELGLKYCGIARKEDYGGEVGLYG